MIGSRPPLVTGQVCADGNQRRNRIPPLLEKARIVPALKSDPTREPWRAAR
jgi:hypothetical protein